MYRFGKALVKAFNPLNVWQDLWKEKHRVLRDETCSNQQSQQHTESIDVPAQRGTLLDSCRESNSPNDPSKLTFQSEDTLNQGGAPSTIRSEHQEDGDEDKTLSFPAVEQRLIPSPLLEKEVSSTPTAGLTTGGQSRKRTWPHHEETDPRSAVPPTPVQAPTPGTEAGHPSLRTLRQQPSRKQLKKQRKLNEKISNLESQLNKARQELQDSVENPTYDGFSPLGSPSKLSLLWPGLSSLGSVISDGTINGQQTEKGLPLDMPGTAPLGSKELSSGNVPRESALENNVGSSSRKSNVEDAKSTAEKSRKRLEPMQETPDSASKKRKIERIPGNEGEMSLNSSTNMDPSRNVVYKWGSKLTPRDEKMGMLRCPNNDDCAMIGNTSSPTSSISNTPQSSAAQRPKKGACPRAANGVDSILCQDEPPMGNHHGKTLTRHESVIHHNQPPIPFLGPPGSTPPASRSLSPSKRMTRLNVTLPSYKARKSPKAMTKGGVDGHAARLEVTQGRMSEDDIPPVPSVPEKFKHRVARAPSAAAQTRRDHGSPSTEQPWSGWDDDVF